MQLRWNKRLLREVAPLVLNNIGYVPTALHVWHLLKNAQMTPVNDYQIPFRADGISYLQHKERKDIICRANWLLREVSVSEPERLISKMPKIIGRQFQGQWAIYACSMTAFALCNIIRLFPETKEKYLHRIPELIDLVNTSTIRFYDTMWWEEDAMETLDGDNSHMTYLSILAWMIGQYQLAGGDDRYETLHKKLCKTLNRRMRQSHDLNLPSFPNGVVFLPDMMFCVLALKDYSTIHNGEFSDTVRLWLHMAKNNWIDKKTGLLYSCYYRNRTAGRISGAYAGLNCTGLVLLDEEFGRTQFQIMKRTLGVQFVNECKPYIGIKEYIEHPSKIMFDIDAGPVIYGLSPSGIAFSMGAATYLGDWSFRKGLLATAELGGHTVSSRGTRHYRLAKIMLTGEAITLAMRTMVNLDEINRPKYQL